MGQKDKKLTIEDFKKKLLAIGYLVPHIKEQAHAQKNGLILHRLSNGARILMAQRITSDDRHAVLNFHFLSGGYFDAPTREGAHHLLEHLFFSGKLSRFLNKHYINHNAYTSQMRVSVYNDGIYNTAHPKTGLLQGLPRTMDGIINPPGLVIPENFSFEKKVVLREISEHSGDYKALTYEKFYSVLLEPQNPYANSPLGTVESVNSITQADIQKILDERIVTSNLIMTGLSNGQGGEAEKLSKIVEGHLKNFPRKGQKTKIDLDLYSKIKTVSSSAPSRHKIQINNKLVSIFLVWKFTIESFSQDSVGFSFITSHIRNVFFNEAREMGLGYTLDVFHLNLLPDIAFLASFVVVPQDEEKESIEKLKNLMDRVIKTEKENIGELKELLDIEKATQLASPISQNSRLETSLNTLVDFDMIADSNVGREVYAKVTLETLLKMLDMIGNSMPVVVVVGDIQ